MAKCETVGKFALTWRLTVVYRSMERSKSLKITNEYLPQPLAA